MHQGSLVSSFASAVSALVTVESIVHQEERLEKDGVGIVLDEEEEQTTIIVKDVGSEAVSKPSYHVAGTAMD